MNWDDKREVKKGDLGESICRSLLESDKYVVYEAVTKKAHLIDFFCHRESKEIIGAEVKSKRRTKKCFWGDVPGTGFDIRHYKEYLHLQEKHNIEIKMFFVDEYEELIYGGWLSDLMNNAIKVKDVVLFRLDEMDIFYKLSETQVSNLKALSRSKQDYEGVKAYFNQKKKVIKNPMQGKLFNHWDI